MVYAQKKLEEMLKNKEFFNFYVFYGEEHFFIKNFVKKILNAADLKKFREFNLKTVYYDEFDFEDLQSFLNTAPFISEKKIFILKDFSISNLNSSFIEKLKSILQDIPDYFILILIVNVNSISFKKSIVFKKLVEQAAVVEFLYKTEEWLCEKILKSIEKKGFYITRENLIFFIRRVGKSIEKLKIELDKIFSFVLEGEIKKEDILNLTIKNIDENAFYIAKYLLSKRKEEALKIFNDLEKEGISESLIFGAISCCFVDLYRAKSAKLKGIRIGELSKIFNYSGKEFRIRNAFLNCNLFSIEKLKKFVVLLSKIDVLMKTKNIPKKILLENFLFKVK